MRFTGEARAWVGRRGASRWRVGRYVMASAALFMICSAGLCGFGFDVRASLSVESEYSVGPTAEFGCGNVPFTSDDVQQVERRLCRADRWEKSRRDRFGGKQPDFSVGS